MASQSLAHPFLSEVYLYCIQAADGPIKIGLSRYPENRLDDLQSGCPLTLKLVAAWPGCLQDERALHQAFRVFRLRGEWFQPAPEILAYVSLAERAWLLNLPAPAVPETKADIPLEPASRPRPPSPFRKKLRRLPVGVVEKKSCDVYGKVKTSRYVRIRYRGPDGKRHAKWAKFEGNTSDARALREKLLRGLESGPTE